jgi:hypothetical protein
VAFEMRRNKKSMRRHVSSWTRKDIELSIEKVDFFCIQNLTQNCDLKLGKAFEPLKVFFVVNKKLINFFGLKMEERK